MALTVKHSTTVATADDADYEVGSDEWNAAHDLTGALPVANGGTGQTTEAEALGEMIQALTADADPIISTDYIVTYDASADTGKKVLLSNVVRKILTADTTFYVRTDGSDSNDGSADTAGSAWLTPQHAYDYLCANYDFNGNDITIKIGDGTYLPSSVVGPAGVYPGGSAVILALQPWTGGGSLRITGNLSDPTQCYFHAYNVSKAGLVVAGFDLPGPMYIGGLKVDAGHEGINMQGGGNIVIDGDMRMLGCTNGQFTCYGGGGISFAAGITVTIDGTGNFPSAATFLAESGGGIAMGLCTFAFVNSPRVTNLSRAQIGGQVYNNGSTMTGTFIGSPYLSRWGGVLINCYPRVSGYPDGTLPGIVYPDATAMGRDRIRDLLVTESMTSNTDITVTDDTTELWGYIEVSAKVNFKFTAWYSTPTAADFKFELDGGGTTPTFLAYVIRYIGPDDTSLQTTGVKTSYNVLTTITASTGTVGYVEIEGVLHNSATTAHDLTFRWAQNTSNASPTKVYAGSCAIVSRFG